MNFSGPARLRGVTLIEMLVTILLVSIIATAAFPVAHLTRKRQQETELKRSLREIRLAIDAYKKAADEGRITKRADESGYPSRLDNLVNGVPNAKVSRGKTLSPRNIFVVYPWIQ